MDALGGCTTNGKIFWRLEDKQVASILVDDWFEPSSSAFNVRNDMQSILGARQALGSPCWSV